MCYIARAWDRLPYDPTRSGMLGKPQLPLFEDAEALVVGDVLARQFVVTGTTPTYGDLTEAVESYLGQFDRRRQ